MQIYISIFRHQETHALSQMRNASSSTFPSLFIHPLSLVKTTNRGAPIATQEQETRSPRYHLMPVHVDTSPEYELTYTCDHTPKPS